MTKTEFQTTEAKINKLLRDIFMSFGVSCSFFDMSGRQLGCCGYESRSNFCRFIHFFDAKQICRQSYLQGFGESEFRQEPLVYFCPFGLVNITFPIIQPQKDPFFVTAGPLLYQVPDDCMITNILDLNFLLKPRAREIRQHLSEITVKSEAEVYSMISIIQNALKGITLLLEEDASPSQENRLEAATTIQLWLRENSYDRDTLSYNQIISELFPENQGMCNNYSQKELEKIISTFTDYIFSETNIKIMIHRALRYTEVLMELTKESGIYLEQIFNPSAIDLEKIISVQNREELENVIIANNNIFMRSYLAKKEVHNKDVIFRAMHYIRNHYSDISLKDVAAAVNLNPAYFSNFFKRTTGQSYSMYLNKIRIEESKRLLLTDCSLSEIAQRVGFSDQSYFTNVFRKVEGISPNRWKNAQEKKEELPL